MNDLYDTDVVEWSERQAGFLRAFADRQSSNEVLDWDNIIEEIESVGRSQVQSVESLLMQAFLHDLKVAAWPHSLTVPHWQAEARGFRRTARRRITPSMHHKVDVAGLFRDALDALPETMDGYPPSPEGLTHAAAARPATLDEAMKDAAGEGVPAKA